MNYLMAVKQILILLIFVFQSETYGQSKCENLFQTSTSQIKSGAQVLHEKDQQLHMSKLVQKVVTKHKQTTGVTLTKPNDKLNQWLNYLTKISTKAESSPRTLDKVKAILNNQLVIKENDVPESYYALQVKIAKERGHGEITLTNDQKNQLADTVIITDQKKSLESWTEYLVSKDTNMYPMWVKYWMFSGMTKLSKYNATNGQFGNRDKSTVAPFAELNREALGLVVDSVLKYTNKKSLEEINDPELVQLLSGLNFGKLYGHVLFKLGVGKEGAFKTNLGQWVVYPWGSNHIPLIKSLEGRNTGWCTAGESTAQSQLSQGDFHVYYSLDENGNATLPRVAIRMEGDNIAEVRGVADSQNLDPQINQSTIVTSKMKEFGSKGDKFKKQDHDMKLLTQIELKHNSKIQLTKEEILFLYEMNIKINGFGYRKDPRIEKIKSERDLKSDIMFVYDNKYNRDEITTTTEEFGLGRSKIHFGNLNLNSLTNASELKLPEILNGYLDLMGLNNASGLRLPHTVNGALYLRGLTNASELKLPDTMNGDLDLSGLINASGLKLPDPVNGALSLRGLTNASELKLPHTVNGGLDLSGLIKASGLKLPDTVNGYLDLRGLINATELKLPDTVNGDLRLSSLTNASKLKLPKGVGYYYGPKDIQR